MGELTVREKVEVLEEMLEIGAIDELDYFSTLCVMHFGFYCDLGKEEEFLKSIENIELTDKFLAEFKETNKIIHRLTPDQIINGLMNSEVKS